MVTENDAFASGRIVAIGQAKATLTPMDVPQLQRLEHVRALFPTRGSTGRRSSCCSRAVTGGFDKMGGISLPGHATLIKNQ
ncbi:hypothetical protein GBF35_44530 [Nonomuraea phyllanthi]|uniref:hypothetical protein n=1 Tax=Nonomuraea phyllanthi TaxID=2219224 RepID=UPI0012940A07|nr:hypothetical protein [Nonomuraea phyllanthi]QFY12702.1 hypothetical protein GBF35_44530 [Nonomuraea phyllanthi]